jgi:hypothetical protein
VAVSASAVLHLRHELIPVGVFVAIGAPLGFELEIVVRAFALMTARTRDRLMPAIEGKLGASVLFHREQRRPEPLLVVTRLAVRLSEAPAVDVSMTVATLLELQTTIALLHGELRRVTALARSLPVHALERERRERMGA